MASPSYQWYRMGDNPSGYKEETQGSKEGKIKTRLDMETTSTLYDIIERYLQRLYYILSLRSLVLPTM